MRKIIYTSGATKNVTPEESYNWRKNTREYFKYHLYNVDVFIPEEHFSYQDPPQTEKECMSLFLYKLAKSDFVLVNLNNSDTSVGTGIEIGMALQLGKPIIGFGTTHIYPWIKEACNVTLNTIEESLEYIRLHYVEV